MRIAEDNVMPAPRIWDVPCNCPCCGWMGIVEDCGPADNSGLECPICEEFVDVGYP